MQLPSRPSVTAFVAARSGADITPLRHPVAKGWLVHSVTALGAVCGMFGLIAVSDRQPRLAIMWLAVAMVLDGADGPVARAWSVRDHVPRIDGYTLDLVVDYVTCIVVPVLFLHAFGMLPAGWSLVIGAFVLFTSALWMSRTDQMTEDHWFNGFPCEWNLVVPSLYLLRTEPWVTAVVCLVLALTQFTDWKFVHPVRVHALRLLNIAVTSVWLLTVLVMVAAPSESFEPGRWLLVLSPLYMLGLGLWRTAGWGVVQPPAERVADQVA